MKLVNPIKLNSNEWPDTPIGDEEAASGWMANKDTMTCGHEELLFKMLEEGFQLDKDVIQEVFGQCGYDVQKSVDELLNISASTLSKSDDIVGISGERARFTGAAIEKPPYMSTGRQSDLECLLSQELPQGYGARAMKKSVRGSKKKDKMKCDLSKEIMHSLFALPERFEEAPKRMLPEKDMRRSRLGEVITGSLRETIKKETNVTVAIRSQVAKEVHDKASEDNYESSRKAVQEYWAMMRNYHKAAFEAFLKGDHSRANKLLEKGYFFNKKAREADEESAQKLLKSSCSNEEIVCLDLRSYDPKEATRLLRLHLTSLSGISTIKFLRITVGSGSEDTTRGAQKRLIMKQLERESIRWTKEDNGRVLTIQVDVINPRSLKFAKN